MPAAELDARCGTNRRTQHAAVWFATLATITATLAATMAQADDTIRLDDDFATDSREKYQVIGPVQWRQGELALGEEAELKLTLQADVVAEFSAELELKPPGKNEKRTVTQLSISTLERFQGKLQLYPRTAIVDLRIEPGERQVQVYVMDRHGLPDQSELRIVRPLRGVPPPTVALPADERWTIRFRHGLIYVMHGQREVAVAHVPMHGKTISEIGVQLRSGTAVCRHLRFVADPAKVQLKPQQLQSYQHARKLHLEVLRLWRMGKSKEALPLAAECLDRYIETFGEHSHMTAIAHHNLASQYGALGDSARAEPHQRRSLEIVSDILGPEHPDTNNARRALASLYLRMGDRALAEPLIRQTLESAERVDGHVHFHTMQSLESLADLLISQGRAGEAEALARELVAISHQEQGPHFGIDGSSRLLLARILIQRGKYAETIPFLDQARQIYARQGDSAKHQLTNVQLELGKLHLAQGDFRQAEPLLTAAVTSFQEDLGAGSLTSKAQRYLASLYVQSGKDHLAEPLLSESLDSQRRFMNAMFGGMTERLQLQMTVGARSLLDSYVSLNQRLHGPAENSYRHVLNWKGVVLANQQLASVGRRNPALRPQLEQLQLLSGQLATLTLSVPPPNQQVAWRTHLATLRESKEALERDLLAQSVEFRRSVEPIEVAAVQQALPPGTILVDYLVYQRTAEAGIQPNGRRQLSSVRHLTAFIVERDSVLQVDLGPMANIERAIRQWRSAITPAAPGSRRQSISISETGDELRNLVWAALEPHLSETETVLYSPDGALGRIPLAALPGKTEGTYLLEERQLAVTAVPQLLPELVAKERPADSLQTLLLVGDVDFNAVAETRLNRQLAHSPAARTRALALGGLFQPLPGTVAEVEAVSAAFLASFPAGHTQLLRGRNASEGAFRDLTSNCRWLHLATHGYFAPAQVRSAVRTAIDSNTTLSVESRITGGVHPGLLSGLALSGANQPTSAGDDGVLSSLEVAALDLGSVELAVLSACETGLGTAAGGEGLLGLQRAFQVAGADTIVASLWQVDDAATQALMTEFYNNLWRKRLGKLAALRQAQLTLLKRYSPTQGKLRGLNIVARPTANDPLFPGGRLSPQYWAPFVLAGDWR